MRKFNLDKTNKADGVSGNNTPNMNNIGNIGEIMGLINSFGGNGAMNQAELIGKLMSMQNPMKSGEGGNFPPSIDDIIKKTMGAAQSEKSQPHNDNDEKANQSQRRSSQSATQKSDTPHSNVKANDPVKTSAEMTAYERANSVSGNAPILSDKAKRYIRFSNNHDRIVNKILNKNN